MMHPLLAGIDSGWALVILGTVGTVGGIGGWLYERWQTGRRQIEVEAKTDAEAPANNLIASAQAAEAIARAAASLVLPLQQTISGLQQDIGALRTEVRTSREAEARCQEDLAGMRGKLREVTDQLGIEPNG